MQSRRRISAKQVLGGACAAVGLVLFLPTGSRAATFTITRVSSTIIPDSSGVNESYPRAADGVLYVTTSAAHVVAINGQSGKVLWQFVPTLHVPQGIPEINRGVTIGPHTVYVLTPDDHLIALNRRTGHPQFNVTVADVNGGTFESMAPLLAAGRVIVGSSGGDEGIRGFVAAYDAVTGRFLWRFYTIPARGSGWVPKSGDHGGGAVWTTPAYNPATHAIYFGTGNPSPDYFGASRPGADLYTDSVVSLDIRNGRLNWYDQEVAHDLWDYDVASPPLLFPFAGTKGGLAVGEAGKDGYWYEWNASTGAALTRPVAFVKEDHTPPTATGTLEWPGPGGGANYGPSAYSPATREAYIAGINGPETIYAGPTEHSSYRTDFGTHQAPAPKSDWTGTVTAVQTRTGKIAWQVTLPASPIGGITNDGDGTLSLALPDGTMEVLSARTGRTLWQTRLGAPLGAAPTAYRWRGATYLAVVTGGSSSLSLMYPWRGADEVVTYRLSTSQP